MNEILRWIFIAIGFIGAILTIVFSGLNFRRTFKTKSNNLQIQWIILFSNVMMFVYSFGLSMINLHSANFYNSMPTWIGNGVALIINSVLTFFIYFYAKKKLKKH